MRHPIHHPSYPCASTPRTVELSGRVVHIAAGARHTCVVREAGDVLCSGKNDYGQLGDGTLKDRAHFVPVEGIGDAVEVAAGDSHTCARHRTGGVSCWGSDYSGALGDGPQAQRSCGDPLLLCSPLPVQVAGIGSATRIAAGWNRSCAVVDGEGATPSPPVLCWGHNSWGILGVGDSNGDRHEPAPLAAVAGRSLDDIVDVEIGTHHTCARARGGRLDCWGHNEKGQLGLPDSSHTTMVVAPTLDRVVAVATGHYHSCAVQRSGKVLCWGEGDEGQLGDGREDPIGPVPTEVHEIRSAVAVTAGADHSCALLRAGDVLCWGTDVLGELGDGVAQPGAKACRGWPCSPTPVRVALQP